MSHPNPFAPIAFFLRALCVPLLFFATANAQRCLHADVYLYNGNILTGKDLLTAHPERVTHLAIANGRIIDTQTDFNSPNSCEVAKQKIDLHGAFTMPGFNDAHTHMAFAGQQHLTLDLDNIPSLAAMQSKIAAYATRLQPNQWITGGGWDHTKWAIATLPTRQDLDKVTANHPAYLERTDGHIAILNTAALTAAGITNKTIAPTGGQIDLDPTTHEPTGIIRDAALALIKPNIPKPTPELRTLALQLSIADALAHGVTSVQDFSDWDDFLALEGLEKQGELHLRFSEWLTFNDPLETLKAQRAHHDLNDPLLHTGMLKGFMDGSLGSRTAALAAPYTDDPKNSGLPRYDQEKLNTLTTERAEAGFQIGFHAIGDLANHMALMAFSTANLAAQTAKDDQQRVESEACFTAHPEARNIADSCGTFPRPRVLASQAQRFRIEHAQVLLPADFDRFANLHIIASMQPSHLLTDMAWAQDRLGPERIKYAYAWKSFLNHGVTLAFGTDYPVESINPFRGLYAAITRMNEAGTQTFQPQEKLTLNEALYAYTQGSAFAENEKKLKGILAPGYLADIVVLDRDITSATPQELLHTHVLRTLLSGETVYLAPNFSQNKVHEQK